MSFVTNSQSYPSFEILFRYSFSFVFVFDLFLFVCLFCRVRIKMVRYSERIPLGGGEWFNFDTSNLSINFNFTSHSDKTKDG